MQQAFACFPAKALKGDGTSRGSNQHLGLSRVNKICRQFTFFTHCACGNMGKISPVDSIHVIVVFMCGLDQSVSH